MIHIDKSHSIKIVKLSLVVLSYTVSLGISIYLLLGFLKLQGKSSILESTISAIQNDQENFKANFSEELFEEHLKLMQKRKIESELDSLALEIEKLSLTQQGSLALTVDKIYDLYGDYQAKLKRNDGVKVATATSKSASATWGDLLIAKDFDTLTAAITTENTSLDATYKTYLDSLPKYTAPASGSGYSYLTVTTERGTTHGVFLIKVPLSQYRVKTIAAIEDDCSDNCATKPLAQYVQENNGFAGMNGSYACPPDYASCAGKVNSFDFALYDSNDDKWLNENALTWFDTGMMTFSGNSANFYKKTSEYDGDSVDAAVSNFPSLLKNGEVVVDDGDIDSYQKTKALRGAIGIGGENIYLAHITSASVIDAAYVMKSLGAKHALNLDGGGTAAMYINGGYVVGPGRGLANAIVLVK